MFEEVARGQEEVASGRWPVAGGNNFYGPPALSSELSAAGDLSSEIVACAATGHQPPATGHSPFGHFPCQLRHLGTMRYANAFALQQRFVEQRKRGDIPDQLLFVEHPHVVTMGRSGHDENLLAQPDLLERAGIEFHPSDRGGDVTYHGPGQIVGYPIVDLREWKRDVVAYVRGLEQVLIDALAEFGIAAGREPGATGVWTAEVAESRGSRAKIAAIGVHISRWVTSHGFALNLDTDLSYFRYIVPCGLARPVTSMRELGSIAGRDEVTAALGRSFGRVFGRKMENV